MRGLRTSWVIWANIWPFVAGQTGAVGLSPRDVFAHNEPAFAAGQRYHVDVEQAVSEAQSFVASGGKGLERCGGRTTGGCGPQLLCGRVGKAHAGVVDHQQACANGVEDAAEASGENVQGVGALGQSPVPLGHRFSHGVELAGQHRDLVVAADRQPPGIVALCQALDLGGELAHRSQRHERSRCQHARQHHGQDRQGA